MTQKTKALRSMDDGDQLMRDRTPFRTRVRLWDRNGNYGPLVSYSGTIPCRVIGDWFRKYPEGDCVSASATHTDPWGTRQTGSIEDFCHTKGNLPSEYHESLRAADFVVRSFATPIAWHVNAPLDWADAEDVALWLTDDHPGVWIIPDVSYSITTYQHQGQVRCALDGSWRNRLQPVPSQQLSIEGALRRVPSGSR